MKAKDLAKLLMCYPEFEVQCITCETSNSVDKHRWPDYKSFNVIGIVDIGHSDKVIMLDIE